MKYLLYIFLSTLLFSCNAQKENSLFKNEKGEYIDIGFYKQSIIPGLESEKPYDQYTVSLTPEVQGSFEVRNENDKPLQIYVQMQSLSGAESTLITFTNRSQFFNEDELTLVWNNGSKELFSKLPKPEVQNTLPRP